MIRIYYARYGGTSDMPCENVSAGFDSLYNLEEDGEGFGIGVYDEETKTFYHKPCTVYGKTDEQLLAEKLTALKNVGVIPEITSLYND